MIASDDDQQYWSKRSNKTLSFLGLVGFRPLFTTTIACVLLVVAAAWDAFPASLVAVGAFCMALMFPYKGYFSPVLSGFENTISALGTFVVTRSVLITLAVVVSSHGLVASVACALLYVCLALELSLRTLLARTLPIAANLGSVSQAEKRSVNPGVVFLASLFVIASLAISDYFVLFDVFALVVSFAMFSFLSWRIYVAVLRIRSRQRAGKRLTTALISYEPKFLIHWNAPEGTSYQLSMWLPHLERLGQNYFVLVRNSHNFREASALTDRPVVLRETLSSLDSVIVPSLKAALYVNTATLNNHLVRYRQMTHIQLNHGDSDKAPSSNPAFRAFDRNFVSGQAAIDRFAAQSVSTAPDFFEIVGRPQTERIEVSSGPTNKGNPTVLYAPTWHGFYDDTDYSSLLSADLIIDELVAVGARVIFRPHPYSMRSASHRRVCEQINKRLEQDPGLHVYGDDAMEPPIFDLFNQSDLMVSDVSSILSDYLVSEKPFVVVSKPQSENLIGRLGEAGYVFSIHDSSDALRTLITTALSNDPHRSDRRLLKQYYVGAEGSMVFEDRLLEYLT